MTEGNNTTEITPQEEVKEVAPRLRVLIIDMNPMLKQRVRISQELFGTDSDSVEKFAQLAVTSVNTPKKDTEPSLFGREKKTSLYFPESVDDFAAIVITGSPFAAYPREEQGKAFLASWKKELFVFIRKANEHKIPLLGICFGEHALAEAMGGTVMKMRSKNGDFPTERGWAVVKKSSGAYNDPLLYGVSDEFVAPENHEDIVARLPEGATLLAENEYGVQGFRIGNSWGFEFHPERLPARMEKYFADSEIIQEIKSQGKDPEKIIELGKKYDDSIRRIFGNFLRFAWKNRQ